MQTHSVDEECLGTNLKEDLFGVLCNTHFREFIHNHRMMLLDVLRIY
jgi:hypothetical protein